MDRNGLQFFWKYVLKQDWQWLEIIKAPKIQSLPDILTLREVERLIGAARKLRYRVFVLATYSMGPVLHTHSRRLDYQPHLHVIVPGGGINRTTRQWKKTRGKFLFKQTALARVFRARLLAAIKTAGLVLPGKLPDEWVVDCKHVGKGAPATHPTRETHVTL